MAVGTLFTAGVVVVAKALDDSYPVIELIWFRYAVHMAVAALAFGPHLKTELLSTGQLRSQLFRSVLLFMTTTLFFLALRFLPVAETTAIVYISPLITVVLAGPLLNERASTRTMATAAVGFAAVIVVIQPFSGRFGIAVLLPLGAAITSSFYLMATRLIGCRDSAPTTWFYTGSVGFIITTIVVPFSWVHPGSLGDLGLLISLGVLGGVGHLMLIAAHQRSPASTLAPLGYLELAFVTVMGSIAFDEFPNTLSLLGIGFIAASGIAVAIQRSTPEAHPIEL